MGRYTKGKGKLQQKEWGGFKNLGHMVHFLSKTSRTEPRWQSVAVRSAQDFLDARATPKYTVKRDDLRQIIHLHPHQLGRELMHDFRRSRKNNKVGAGIKEAIWSVINEGSHLLGVDALVEWVGSGPKHVPMTAKQETVASAVQQSYKSIDERKATVGDMNRLSEYDTDRIAVWREANGQLLITVHGTKMTASDIADDLYITAGGETRDSELETLLGQLDSQGVSYDLAGHSLATQFIQNAVIDGHATGADDIFLFNPASSPLQDTNYLRTNANDDRYTYFINQGDLVSSGLYQQMNQDTMDNRVHMGPYRYDPLQAHYMDQWVPEEGVDP